MYVYVARHARTDWNDQDRIQGQTNTVLNERGLRQAKQLARALSTVCPPPVEIVSSDLHRARQTATVVALTLGLPPVVHDRRLRECHHGALEGQFRTAVKRKHGDLYLDADNPAYDYGSVGGENHAQVLRRHLDLLRDLHKKDQLEHCLLVGHGGSLMTLLRFLHHDGTLAEQGDFTLIDFNPELLFS